MICKLVFMATYCRYKGFTCGNVCDWNGLLSMRDAKSGLSVRRMSVVFACSMPSCPHFFAAPILFHCSMPLLALHVVLQVA